MKRGQHDGSEALLVDAEEACDLVVVLDALAAEHVPVEAVRVVYAGCGTHEVAFTWPKGATT